jgi:hypothetical protein
MRMRDPLKDILIYGISIGAFYVMGFALGKMMADEQWGNRLKASGLSTELIDRINKISPFRQPDTSLNSPSNSPIKSLQPFRQPNE